MKMSTSWVGTGTIGISVEFCTYYKKKIRKKNTFKKPSHPLTWRFLDASCDCLWPGSRLRPHLPSTPHRTLSEYTSLGLLPGSEQGDLDDHHIVKLPQILYYRIRATKKHRFFEFWPWRCRLHELGPVPLESALNFALITKKNSKKKHF